MEPGAAKCRPADRCEVLTMELSGGTDWGNERWSNAQENEIPSRV